MNANKREWILTSSQFRQKADVMSRFLRLQPPVRSGIVPQGRFPSAGRLAAGHANRPKIKIGTSRLLRADFRRAALVPLLAGGLCLSALHAAPAHSPRALRAGSARPSAQAPKPGPGKQTPAKTPNGLTIENIHITNWTQIDVQDQQNVTLDGPDIHADITDTKRGAQVHLIADHAVGHKRTPGHNSAELTGNVRYTIIQPIQEGDKEVGKRIVKGTAQRATYTQATNTLRLLGGVDTTMTDPTHFDGPAVLHVASLVMPGEGHFELAGDAGTNDMRFTPHITPPKTPPMSDGNANKKPKAATQAGNMHIHGFATGRLEVGKEARFDGALVTMESTNALEKTETTFKAPHVVANLEKDRQKVEATGGIQYEDRAVDATGNVQHIAVAANSVTWTDGVTAQVEADGTVNATLTNPKMLLEPAVLTVGHLKADLGEEQRYVLTGSPERTRLTLMPKQAKREKGKEDERRKAKGESVGAQQAAPGANVTPNTNPIANPEHPVPNTQHPTPPSPEEADGTEPNPAVEPPLKTPHTPFAFGRMELTGFQTATYVLGQNLVVEGPKVRFTSTDAATKSYAELLTPRLEAEFGLDNTVTMTRAMNTVDFRFEQPVKSNSKSSLTPGSEKGTVMGTARTATFTNGDVEQTMIAEGVGRVAVANLGFALDGTQFTSPGNNGSLNYNLTTRQFDLKNPARDGGFILFTVPPTAPIKTDTGKPKKKRK